MEAKISPLNHLIKVCVCVCACTMPLSIESKKKITMRDYGITFFIKYKNEVEKTQHNRHTHGKKNWKGKKKNVLNTVDCSHLVYVTASIKVQDSEQKKVGCLIKDVLVTISLASNLAIKKKKIEPFKKKKITHFSNMNKNKSFTFS